MRPYAQSYLANGCNSLCRICKIEIFTCLYRHLFRIPFCFSTGEAYRNVTDHCLQAFNAMGLPKVIKTDNGPAYTGNNFNSFCKEFGIEHKTGIPYNPMGQGIVECAHHTLKNWLLKPKRKGNYTPQGHQKYILLLSYLF